MTSPPLFDLQEGDSPLMVNVPHAGCALPPGLERRLTPAAMALPDTDWLVDELYGFVSELGATLLRANFSRYVVDLNRGAQGERLYKNADETETVPTSTFAGSPIYRDRDPNSEDVAGRIRQFWMPYHAALQSQLDRIRHRHGLVILWDAHSIAGRVPRFFSGELPTLNLGTADGASCSTELSHALKEVMCESPHSWVCDGRFKGGFITRHYGNPGKSQHAVQLEISQESYLRAGSPPTLHQKGAQELTTTLHELLAACLKFAETAGRLRDR